MPYLTPEQLEMLSDVLCLCFFGITLTILVMMRTARYGRRLAGEWIKRNGTTFNNELSLVLSGEEHQIGGFSGNKRGDQDKKRKPWEKQPGDEYAEVRRLAGLGLNVQAILEKVNVPRNEIELVVKLGRTDGVSRTRDRAGRRALSSSYHPTS